MPDGGRMKALALSGEKHFFIAFFEVHSLLGPFLLKNSNELVIFRSFANALTESFL